MVVKLQRQSGEKNGVLGAAELQDGGLAQLGAAATKSGNLYRYAHFAHARKKARELFGTIWFVLANRDLI
jgi:hypothetical protein